MYVDTEWALKAYHFFKPRLNTAERRIKKFRRARRNFFKLAKRNPVLAIEIFYRMADIDPSVRALEEWARQAYTGGKVEVFARGLSVLSESQFKELAGEACHYDVNSAYPFESAMPIKPKKPENK